MKYMMDNIEYHTILDLSGSEHIYILGGRINASNTEISALKHFRTKGLGTVVTECSDLLRPS